MGTKITIDMTALGRNGGAARAKALTAGQRKEAARDAAKAKWKKFYRENPDKKRKKKRVAK